MTGWCIGIGICLKIGDIAVSVVFGADKAFSIGKLIGNRKRRRSGKIAGSAFATEDTTRVPQVPSRFGQEQPPFKEILYSFSPKFCFR